jgi:EAL domain-containing protein (putative c-di-GMP-specific phosphodiesterase class I)
VHELLAQVLAGNPAAGGFEVQYQPIVRLAGSETVAVEALACWRHPAGGEVESEQLMSVAQRTGLSGVIEDFVLMQACADAEALSAAFELDVSLHVNVGSGRLTRPDLVTAIEWAVKRYKLEASRGTQETQDR